MPFNGSNNVLTLNQESAKKKIINRRFKKLTIASLYRFGILFLIALIFNMNPEATSLDMLVKDLGTDINNFMWVYLLGIPMGLAALASVLAPFFAVIHRICEGTTSR